MTPDSILKMMEEMPFGTSMLVAATAIAAESVKEIAAERSRSVEECCKAVCYDCARGIPVQHDCDNHADCYGHLDGDPMISAIMNHCDAAPIRRLSKPEAGERARKENSDGR